MDSFPAFRDGSVEVTGRARPTGLAMLPDMALASGHVQTNSSALVIGRARFYLGYRSRSS